MHNAVKIVVIYYSRTHHIESLAKSIAEGVKLVQNSDVILVESNKAIALINEINLADAIVFGSPTYFGSIAAELKSFLDATGQIFIKRSWKNKIAAGFTHSSAPSGDKLNTLIEMMVFAMQQGMIWIGQEAITNAPDYEYKDIQLNRLGGWTGVMTQGTGMPEQEDSFRSSDLLTAKRFGTRIATLALQFKIGNDHS